LKKTFFYDGKYFTFIKDLRNVDVSNCIKINLSKHEKKLEIIGLCIGWFAIIGQFVPNVTKNRQTILEMVCLFL
jgi:hypothetical protein